MGKLTLDTKLLTLVGGHLRRTWYCKEDEVYLMYIAFKVIPLTSGVIFYSIQICGDYM